MDTAVVAYFVLMSSAVGHFERFPSFPGPIVIVLHRGIAAVGVLWVVGEMIILGEGLHFRLRRLIHRRY